VLDPQFLVPATAAILSPAGRVARMLRFEAALAEAQAETGLIPERAARAIAAAAAEGIDTAAVLEAAGAAGNPAIPLVKALGAKLPPEAAPFLHYAATSQDVIDSAVMLQLADCWAAMRIDLDALAAALVDLVQGHRRTVMAGRTLGQQAMPITFGHKAAMWLDAVLRARTRLRTMPAECLMVQYGGAVGTQAGLDPRAEAIVAALARRLGLGVPSVPWHGARDRLVDAASRFALLIGTLGKIAADIALLMQTEIGEAQEAEAGGSSAMPHKRNPVRPLIALAASKAAPGLMATLYGAMAQEHERGLGGWHAEWTALPALVGMAHGALAGMAKTARSLRVDPDAMARNLAATRGLLSAEALAQALAPALGKLAAHAHVEALCRRAVTESRDLKSLAAADPLAAKHLAPAALEAAFDPAQRLGRSEAMIDRVLAEAKRTRDHDG